MKFLTFLFIIATSLACFADGIPNDWQMGFQPASSPVMEKLEGLHDLLLVICFGIVALVFFLIGYIIIKFNKKSNPVPYGPSHNVLIEVIWTVIPVIILLVIAVPSFKILYYMDREPKSDMVLKVVGNQWYWSYQYPDHGNFEFDSTLIKDEDLKPGQLRLLEVDNRVVLPVGATVKVLITASDVIHSWAVPSLGIKMDAIPGRVNETWVKINEPGVYYGQCSELCGVGHGFMPIAVQAVPKEEFVKWTKEAKKKFS